MNIKTIRSIYWAGILVGIVLFALMLWDHFGNNSDAFIGLLIPFLVLVVVLIVLLLLQPDDEAQEFEVVVAKVGEPASDSYYDYKGDIHDVIDIEGIGPTYADRLNDAGIFTTARLCYEGADAVAKASRAPKKTAQSWIAMAQLAKVNGIGKQYGEALVRAGVDGVEALKKGNAAKIATKTQAYLDSLDVNVLGQKVTEKRVQGWQKKVANMRRVRQPIPER